MAYVLNDPADFAEELTSGFALAYSDWVTQVPGGVIRATQVPEGQVAIITGGGSGHYPAFAGLVGPGLASGAAMGNIFASPSAQQVYNVAKAAHTGGGVLLTYGNYAGDVLNFTQAQERLNAEGIECRTVIVTDDIASAPASESEKRRGIAGDLFVFKCAAAAAEAGKSLDEVVEVATLANEMTRTLGVAFSGCTLPGAEEPLFTVPEGRMGVGMGIHGEPGISEEEIPSAHGLAELLVKKLLEEKPESAGSRAAVILNGLGGVKYEELFVLYNSVGKLLEQAGISVVEPDVGELVTSFEMAGVSLTLSWLTPELEEYWSAPANTPAYRKGSRSLGERRSDDELFSLAATDIPESSAASQSAAQVALEIIERVEEIIDANAHHLGELDAIAGDGDHGIGMQRGSHAAAEAARSIHGSEVGVGTLLQRAGDAWADKAGGTSGALWGTMIRAIADRLGNDAEITGELLSSAITDALAAAQAFGKAQVGDKTMIDAVAPFAEKFAAEIATGATLNTALKNAASAADAAAQETADLLPRVGRARPHAEKSLGTPDPGAISFALIAQTAASER